MDSFPNLTDLCRPHFDPESSTTHDVVRQAIIPSSMHFRWEDGKQHDGKHYIIYVIYIYIYLGGSG